jgi:HlyD family secretion protein
MQKGFKATFYHRAACLNLLFVALTGCGQGPSGVFTSAGTVEGREVNISATIQGRIVEVCCDEGDPVRQGQVLVELESAELRAALAQAMAAAQKARAEIQVKTSSVESARAEVAGAEATLQATAAEVRKAEVNLEEAGRELKRATALYKDQVISRAAFDQACTLRRTAAAGLDAARAERAAAQAAKSAADARLDNARDLLASARTGLAVAEADVALARTRLEQTVITSPMDATVVYLAFGPGETASPGVALMTLVDLAHLYVRVDVEETIAADITLQAPAMIRSQGNPEQRLDGRVIVIGAQADFATQRDVSRGQQDIKTFKVKIGVDNPPGWLKPGLTVMVDISRQKQP